MSAPGTRTGRTGAGRPLLAIDDLHLAFSGVQALAGVSLEVTEGELLGVIGPNGAGKTSLFNCISGVVHPQRGSVQLDGRDLRKLAPHRIAALGVARMFQNLALFDQLTALENLLLGCHHHFRTRWWQDVLGTRGARREEVRQRRRVEEVIDLLDLERFRETPAGALPYGVLKRVELGRALCMSPRLLLLDEPGAGLNREETEDMARYLLDVREEWGVTQILIEHELGFVLDLADRVAVLDFGRLLLVAPPEEIRQDPRVIEAYVGGSAQT